MGDGPHFHPDDSLLRMIYRTNWGRQNMDQRIIRVEVGAIPH